MNRKLIMVGLLAAVIQVKFSAHGGCTIASSDNLISECIADCNVDSPYGKGTSCKTLKYDAANTVCNCGDDTCVDAGYTINCNVETFPGQCDGDINCQWTVVFPPSLPVQVQAKVNAGYCGEG